MKKARGRPPHPDILTPAEWQVLNLVRHGASTRQIARLRGTSVDAVKFHTENLQLKLGAAGRAALAHWRGAPAGSALAEENRPVTQDAAKQPLALGPIGQIAHQVSDIKRAEEFYRSALGLKHLFTFGNLAFFDCGGVRLFLTAAEKGPPKPQSILYFKVPDIHAAHAELTARGVEFRGAPHMIHRHTNGVEEWMAFFADPDGHMLAIMAQTAPSG